MQASSAPTVAASPTAGQPAELVDQAWPARCAAQLAAAQARDDQRVAGLGVALQATH
jgi:hypothetical protein